MHLDGHDDIRAGHQGIEREQVDGRWTVDHAIIVLFIDRFELLGQNEFFS